MNNNESSSSGILIGILIVVVIAIVGWIAYAQGLFKGKEEVPTQDTSSLQINVGAGATESPAPKSSY